MDEKIININEGILILRRGFKLIIACAFIFTIIAGIFATFKMKPIYTATVKIFAGKNEDIQSDYSSSELNSYNTLISSYIEIIKTDDFMKKVIEKGNLDMAPGQLMGGLSFTTAQNAPILTIAYTSADPTISEKVVKTLSSEFEVGVKEIILNTYTKIIESVKVVEKLPAKGKVIFTGFIAGLIIGIALVLVIDYLDDSVTKREQLEKILPIPVLGELPLEDEEENSSKKHSISNKIIG